MSARLWWLQFPSIDLIVVALLSVGVATAGAVWTLGRAALDRTRLGRRQKVVAAAALASGTVMAGCLYDAVFIEPDTLDVTHQVVETDALPAGSRLRIVQLSDLHVGRSTPALEALPRTVNALAPDVLIYTGDTLTSPASLPLFRRLMRSISAPEGRFATKGNHDRPPIPADLFQGVATELDGQPIQLRDGRITLCGAPYGSPELIRPCLEGAPASGRIVAYHTPDLVEDLAASRPFLYLAGHTHGGQVRLPFYGALLTFSRFGRKYQMGLYQVGDTTLYVNRGIGGPHVRFLCHPEVAVIDVIGSGHS